MTASTGNGTGRWVRGGVLAIGAALASGCVVHIDGDGPGWTALAYDGDRCESTDTVSLSESATDSLFVRSGPGAVAIRGEADLDEVLVTATLCASSQAILEDLSVTLESGRLEARVPERNGGWWDRDYARIDLDVRVPAVSAIRLEDRSGSVRISDVGAVDIEDGSGSLTIERAAEAQVRDGSGSLEIRQIAGDVTVEDGSGGLRIEGVEGSVTVDDGSGSVRIADVGGDVRLEDRGGSVRVRVVGGSVLVGEDGSGSIGIEGVGGEVRIEDAGSGGVEVRDVEGGLTVRGTKRSRIRYGDIRGEVDVPSR